MIARYFFIITALVCVGSVLCEDEKVFRVTVGTPRDSYLDAYKQSHKNLVKSVDSAVADKKTDRDYNVEQHPIYPGSNSNQYGPPAPQYGPPSPPAPQYGPPSPPEPQYGPPAPQYGPPLAPVYGPPQHQYGPPAPPPPVYGPPSSSVQVFYGMPHAMLSIWDKLKLKLDLFTLGKILLKLVIFKKIVSLIAILCLLLFIPSLKHKVESSGSSNEEDEGDIMRSLQGNAVKAEDKLKNVSAFILEAIENFEAKEKLSSRSCKSVYCKTQKALKDVDKKYSYKKLAKMYSKEQQ